MDDIFTNQELYAKDVNLSDIIDPDCNASEMLQSVFDRTLIKMREEKYLRPFTKPYQNITLDKVFDQYKKDIRTKFCLDDGVEIGIFDLKGPLGNHSWILLENKPDELKEVIATQIDKIQKKYNYNNCGLVSDNIDYEQHFIFVGFTYDFDKVVDEDIDDRIEDWMLIDNLDKYLNDKAGLDSFNGIRVRLMPDNILRVEFNVDSYETPDFDGVKCIETYRDNIIDLIGKEFGIMPNESKYWYSFNCSDYDGVLKYQVTDELLDNIRVMLKMNGYTYDRSQESEEDED